MSPGARRGRGQRLRARAPFLAVALWATGGCTEPSCEEDIRAQVGLVTQPMELGTESALVELAQGDTAIERGWKHRRCGREAIALIPEPAPATMSVWGCGLVDAVDLHFVLNEQVVQAHAQLQPCAEPCTNCPRVESQVPVDGVIESLAGRFELGPGDRVSVWPQP